MIFKKGKMIRFLKEKLLGRRLYLIKRIDRNGQILFVRAWLWREELLDVEHIVSSPDLLRCFDRAEQKKLIVLARYRKFT